MFVGFAKLNSEETAGTRVELVFGNTFFRASAFTVIRVRAGREFPNASACLSIR